MEIILAIVILVIIANVIMGLFSGAGGLLSGLFSMKGVNPLLHIIIWLIMAAIIIAIGRYIIMPMLMPQ